MSGTYQLWFRDLVRVLILFVFLEQPLTPFVRSLMDLSSHRLRRDHDSLQSQASPQRNRLR